MQIDEVIKTTAQILNLTGVAEALAAGKGAQDEDVLKLLCCVDFILDETARDYFPLFKTETLKPKNGRVSYTDFSRVPVGVVWVKANGKKTAFTRLYDAIETVKADEVEIKYCFKPAKAVLGGETEWEDGTPSLRILAYGTAAEYCVMNDMDEEAALWDKRYRDATERARAEKTQRKMRERRWFL